MRLFVDFCVFPRFSLNLPELNLKLFWTAEENNFRFSSGKFREKWGKTQKSTNNLMFSFGLIEKYLAVSYLLSCTAKIPKIMGVANKKTLLQCHAPVCILDCCILNRCRFFRYNLHVCLQLSWIFWNSFHIAQVFVCLHFVNRSECYVRPNLYILWWLQGNLL